MKKVIIIPDSYKGTMTSEQVCVIMRRAVLANFPRAQAVAVPIADGGEGTVNAFLAAAEGERVVIQATGPFGEPIQAAYALLDGGQTAVIEMASCAGLALAEGQLDPLRAGTYGVGTLMADAVGRGARHLVIGLGGSCTNDGGCGAAAAAGAVFYNADGASFVPTGGTLHRISRIDLSALKAAFGGVRVTAMCDIDNPLFGPLGAAHVFGPQKGADAYAVETLDAGLMSFNWVIERELGLKVSGLPGAGAAGGMGAGLSAFFGARLQSGIETLLDTVGFDRMLDGADLVLTGEGRIDSQSLRGKVVVGVARRAKARGVPVVAVVGDIGERMGAIYAEGVSGIFSINRQAVDFARVRDRAPEDLFLAVDNLMHLLAAFKQ